jgi:[acyl-carrier-protein] S-malonyltransferase
VGIGVVFPGQGSQLPGSGARWRAHPAWSIVEEAQSATGLPLDHLVLDATAEELATTRNAQLSVLLTSLLAWRALEPTLAEAEVVGVAGHSLGQLTAMIAAGAVTVADGVRLAVARAEATAAVQAVEPGGMIALLGATETQAWDACGAAPERAWVANVNGGGQVVVGGSPDALVLVAERAAQLGVRRVRPLAVDGAFHTPMMRTAALTLVPTLRTIRFQPPRVPIVTNDARLVTDGDGWPQRLRLHLVQPVRWEQAVRRLVGLGADTIIEVGSGTTLSALTRRIAPRVVARSLAAPDQLPLGILR